MALAAKNRFQAPKWGKEMAVVFITAIIYAALLIPFKPFPIVPGYTEFRPANFVPVLFGALFGPAAAVGSAFGNLVADFYGTLGWGSAFGFVGNFLFAYVAYKIWELFVEKEKDIIELRELGFFWLASLVAGTVCALVIGLGVFVLGLKPLADSLQMVMFISINNFLPAAIIGSVLLAVFYGKLKRAGWIYEAK